MTTATIDPTLAAPKLRPGEDESTFRTRLLHESEDLKMAEHRAIIAKRDEARESRMQSFARSVKAKAKAMLAPDASTIGGQIVAAQIEGYLAPRLEYRSLIERLAAAVKPKAADIASAATLAGELGLTPQAVEQHVETIRRHGSKKAELVSLQKERPSKQRELDEAMATIKTAEQAIADAKLKIGALRGRLSKIDNAPQAVAEIERAHPILFASRDDLATAWQRETGQQQRQADAIRARQNGVGFAV